MTVADIAPAVVVERAAYGAKLPPKNYRYELEQNQLAHYYVLSAVVPQLEKRREAPPETGLGTIIGLGGFWLVAQVTHIMTIAIQPRWQGLGLGEWLLLTIIENGQALGAKLATLEVRPSNRIARSLYHKYNFQEVGRRTGYYSDNGDDAIILSTPSTVLPDFQALITQRKTQLLRRLAQIDVDKIGQIS